MDFGGDATYFLDQGFATDNNTSSKRTNTIVLSKFTKFILEWNEQDRFIYKEELRRNTALQKFKLHVNLAHMENFDREMTEFIRARPMGLMPILEEAVEVAFKTINPEGSVETPRFQVQIESNEHPQPLRVLKSSNIGCLINVSGIIINSGKTMLRGQKIIACCRGCKHEMTFKLASGFDGLQLPLFCQRSKDQGGRDGHSMCPRDPYQILSHRCEYVDFQILKIQECPDAIPTGEVPRTYQVVCDRYLVDKLAPGTRVTITGVYTIMERKKPGRDQQFANGLKIPYIICYSFNTEASGSRRMAPNFTAETQQRYQKYADDPDIYKRISSSVGESIFGHEDIKKALACLLFGGSTKILPDKSRLRGDINMLLLGDPSTAKSQFLKFIQRVAPISVYTSGKGSSAAGLTAAIIKDPNTGEFQLEGGALVLADGGVVCIDEFDKMRPQDRVAIHEAMEQQTISVAKAGITTILNSRTSVLAAANPIFGRYDDQRKVSDQIDLQTTILSRFDCIFIVRDVKDEEGDKRLVRHIIGLHSKANANSENPLRKNFDLDELKNYIMFAKMNISPRMNEESAIALQNLYIEDRKKVRMMKQDKKSHIPVTVRQLEAIIRISESIAKMRLCKEVTKADVEEAHRIFNVSTMKAIKGSFILSGGSTNIDLLLKIEESIKRRIEIGHRMMKERLMEELEGKNFPTEAIHMALSNLANREELISIQEGKAFLRKK